MLEFYLNTTSPQWFGLDGNPFRDNSPSMAFQSRDTVKIIACTETPEAGEENVDPTSWPRDASWAAIPGIGAKITVDNDYIHKLKGTLATEVPAGSTASISATIENASYATVPTSGTVRLFDASGNYEAIAYTARNISGNTVVFTTSGTLTGSYESGATMDCDQSPYCEAHLDTAQSNLEQGEFVFQLVVDSPRLREEMDYTNTARLDVQGLEMLVYKTADGNDEPVKAYLCDTFSITGTIGNVGYEAEPPDPVKNQIAGIVNQLAAAGFEVEQQYDESGNTQFRFRSSSAGGTWSQWITVSKGEKGETGETGAAAGFGTPNVTVETLPAGSDATASVAASGDNTAKVFNFNFGIPKGADGKNGTDGKAGADGVSSYTYVAYASDASGAGFSLTPSNALKFRAEIHTTTAIETPDAEDFAGATWVKYIGDDGTGAGDMTKAVYDTNDDGIVDHAATADAVGATTAAQVADAVGKAHTHANKTTLDKLAEADGKLTYDGAEIGGGSGTVKSVNGQLPDESGNVTIETGGAVDESRLLPENPANGDIPCFDATATIGGGNDANTRILLHFDADEIKDEAAGNAAPVTITKKTGTITVVEGGKWGKCAKYVTGSMTVATNLDELNANNWVVSGWFNPDENNHGVSYPTWLSMDDSSTNGFMFDSTGRYGESDGPLFYLDTPPASGTWHWLAIVKYSGGLRFYLNGAFLNEISAQQRANFCSTLAIGGFAGTYAAGSTERTFSGLVDEVRLQYIPDDKITQWTGTSIAVPDAPYSKPQTVGEWGKLNRAELVQSVNGVTPDENGNVNIDSALTLDQLEYNDVPYKYQGMTIDSSLEDSNMTSRFYGKAVSTFGDSDNTTTFPDFPFKPYLRDDSLVGGEADIYYELWKSDSANTDEWNTIEFKSVNAPSKIIKISAQTAGTDACVMSYTLDGLRKDGAILARIVQGEMTLPASSASNVLGDFSELNFNTNEIAKQYFDSFELKVRTEGASGDKAASGIASIKFMITEKNAAWVGINKKNLVQSINGYKPLDGAVTLPEATASAAGLMAAADKAAIAGLTARGIYPDALVKSGTIDFNEIIDHGFYFIGGDSPHLNYPETYKQSGGTLQVIRTGNYLTQTFNLVGLNKRFIRYGLNALNDSSERTFSAWRRLLTDADITESKTSPGYFKLPGGTIVQWGNFVVTADPQTQEITLPVALSSAYVRQASGSNSSLKIGIYGGTNGKITCYVEGNTSGTVDWMVIGK